MEIGMSDSHQTTEEKPEAPAVREEGNPKPDAEKEPFEDKASFLSVANTSLFSLSLLSSAVYRTA
jgi:hypothetical protein